MLVILVIGVGNAYRGDDGAGLAVIDLLRAERNEVLPDAQLVVCDGDCSLLLEMWDNAGAVILIDAVSSGASPGTIYRFDALARPSPLPGEVSFHSTHAFGVSEALEMGRVLHQLPARLILYGIEGKSFANGTSLSHEAELAARDVAQRVKRELIDLQSL